MSVEQGVVKSKHVRRFLVDDEIVVLHGKFQEEHRFRVRIWRGKNATPVVLAGPQVNEKGASVPSRMTTKLANYALALAGYPDSGILHFEHDPPRGGHVPAPSQVHFDFFGHASRLRLYRPMHRFLTWSELEEIVGEPIER